MPRKVFVAGEILTASDVNTNLMDQSVMVFDDDAARTTAIPTPVEGMVTYLKDTDEVDKFDGSAFVPVGIAPAILQVVQTVKSNVFSTTSAAYEDVTGLSVTITPSSTASKVLVFADIKIGTTPEINSTSDSGAIAQVVRDSTAIYLGDVSGSRTRGSLSAGSNAFIQNSAAIFLDSPSSTSALTYKIQLRVGGGGTAFIGRTGFDNDQPRHGSVPSSITVMEVAG